MDDQLISFDTAKLLKEKVFKEITTWYYTQKQRQNPKHLKLYTPELDICSYEKWDSWNDKTPYIFGKFSKHYYSVVTQSLLQRWLREVHNKHLSINFHQGSSWSYSIEELKFEGSWFLEHSEKRFNSYEGALEAGLLKSLSLIK